MLSSFLLISESEVFNSNSIPNSTSSVWLYDLSNSNLNPTSKYCLIPETSASSSNQKEDGISQHTLCHLSNDYALVASATKPLVYIWNLNLKVCFNILQPGIYRIYTLLFNIFRNAHALDWSHLGEYPVLQQALMLSTLFLELASVCIFGWYHL